MGASFMQTTLSADVLLLVQCTSELVTVTLLFAFGSFNAHLLVVFLQRSKILACFRELAFLHSFSDVPVHKRTLRVHEIKLVVDTGENFCDGRGIADHACSTHDLGKITTRHHGGRLVVDSTFESSWTPVHKLDGSFRFDSGYCCVD